MSKDDLYDREFGEEEEEEQQEPEEGGSEDEPYEFDDPDEGID